MSGERLIAARKLAAEGWRVAILSSSGRGEALAHELGMKVVAEGVEDEACLARLAEMGCDTAQGWQIGKPMPASQIARLAADEMDEAA